MGNHADALQGYVHDRQRRVSGRRREIHRLAMPSFCAIATIAVRVLPLAVPIIMRRRTTSNGKLTVAEVTAARAPYSMLFWAGIVELPVTCTGPAMVSLVRARCGIWRDHLLRQALGEDVKSGQTSHCPEHHH